MSELCPSCGIREQDTPSGICSECVVKRAAENYSEADRGRAERRTRAWGNMPHTRVDARLASLRQQRHRQLAAIRPTMPAQSLDPWELAIGALGRLKRLVVSVPAHRGEIDSVMETVKRLAWGPDDGDVWLPKARSRRRHEIPGQLQLWDADVEVAA